MRTRFVSLTAAAVLAVAVAAPASAANVTDGFSLECSLSVSGVPASITYTDGGNPMSIGVVSGWESFSPSVSSNCAVDVDVSGTQFTAGGATMDQDVREVDPGDGTLFTVNPLFTAGGFADTSVAEAVSPLLSATPTAAFTDETFDLIFRVDLDNAPAPLNPLGGAYSGSITVDIANP